jgi:hypothetical protein
MNYSEQTSSSDILFHNHLGNTSNNIMNNNNMTDIKLSMQNEHLTALNNNIKNEDTVYEFRTLYKELATTTTTTTPGNCDNNSPHLDNSPSKPAVTMVNGSSLLDYQQQQTTCDMDWNESMSIFQDFEDQYSIINKINNVPTIANGQTNNMRVLIDPNNRYDMNKPITHMLEQQQQIDVYNGGDSNNLTFNFDVSNDGQTGNGGEIQHQSSTNYSGVNGGWTSLSETGTKTSDPLIGRSAFIDNGANTDSGIVVPWELIEPDYNQIINNYF